MKYLFVFALDADPAVSFMDVTAMAQLAAVNFNRAVTPLGKCKLDAIKKIEPPAAVQGGFEVEQGSFGVDHTAEIAQASLKLLLAEGEWHVEYWQGSQGHNLVCSTCGASHANTVAGHPNAKHHPNCEREAFFAEARKLGL
jgi:hypothetical protein